MMKKEPVQASRLIPRHTFAQLDATIQKKGVADSGIPKIAQLIDLRLPGNLSNGIRVQSACFNDKKYEVEPDVSFKDEKGILNTKRCAVGNFLRWRYTTDPAPKEPIKETPAAKAEREKMDKQIGCLYKDVPKMESNAKVVEWSDGSKSLFIGDQVFDIQSEVVHRAQCFAQYSKFQLLKAQVSSKMIVKPSYRSHVMQRMDSHTVTEEQVKFTLATDAQQDMMYGIDKAQEDRDNDDDAKGDQAVGQKRKFNQLAKVMDHDQDSDSDDDEEDYSSAGGAQLALKNKRAKRDAEENAAALNANGEKQVQGELQKGAPNGVARNALHYQDNKAYESGSEDEFVPGYTIKQATEPVVETEKKD